MTSYISGLELDSKHYASRLADANYSGVPYQYSDTASPYRTKLGGSNYSGYTSDLYEGDSTGRKSNYLSTSPSRFEAISSEYRPTYSSPSSGIYSTNYSSSPRNYTNYPSSQIRSRPSALKYLSSKSSNYQSSYEVGNYYGYKGISDYTPSPYVPYTSAYVSFFIRK